MNTLFELPAAPDKRRIFGVSELSRLIKATLEDEIGQVWIEGEVSGLKRPASGHLYFDLKDAEGLINAVLFKGSMAFVKAPIENGLQIRVFGTVTSYPQRSCYQVLVRKVEPVGKGNLQEKFEQLKAALQKEGLFDAARKRKLPLLPRRIGIVTSPTGAAIRDILNILDRRYPNLEVLLAPVKVQGDGAAASIVAAIEFLNRRGGLDVLIVGRGGGSLEDLWAFNEEIVARAIARSAIPVISAVGHEIDFTISDFVADLRAPTPSAAAELVVRAKSEWEDLLDAHQRRLQRALQAEVLEFRGRFNRASHSYVFREPHNLVRHFRQKLANCRQTLAASLRNSFSEAQQRVDEAALCIGHQARLRAQACSAELQRVSLQLRALNPTAVLERGYSITSKGRTLVRKPGDVAAGDILETRLAQGTITSKVTRGEK